MSQPLDISHEWGEVTLTLTLNERSIGRIRDIMLADAPTGTELNRGDVRDYLLGLICNDLQQPVEELALYVHLGLLKGQVLALHPGVQTCAGCGRMIIKALNRATGKTVPLDALSVAYTLELHDGEPEARRVPAYINHFQTCRNANQFSRRGKHK